MSKKKITDRIHRTNHISKPIQKKFAETYVKTGNAAEAYAVTHPKSTRESAGKNANRMKLNEGVRGEIQKALVRLDRQSDVRMHHVINKFVEIAFDDHNRDQVIALKALAQILGTEIKDLLNLDAYSSSDLMEIGLKGLMDLAVGKGAVSIEARKILTYMEQNNAGKF